MSGFVVAAVLFGALLHACWNALVKGSSDKAMDTALMQLTGACIALPAACVIGWPRAEAWPWLLASLGIHVVYSWSLAGAYRHGDLGLTYPLMRGSAPLLVALSSAAWLAEPLRPLAWGGVLGICAGVLVLGLTRHALDSPRAVGFALVNAVVIALYTLADAMGARASGQSLSYVTALVALNGWVFPLLVLRRRGLATVLPYARQRWPVATGAALASFGAYAITLWAMTQAPVATVAALRETSVLFAVLLGTWFLRERFTRQRALGTAVIVAGVAALRLA